MIRILLNGIAGHMGKAILAAASENGAVEIVCGVDRMPAPDAGCPVFSSFDEVNVPVDLIIDFSVAAAFDGVLDYALSKKLPAVIGTTGLTEEQIARLDEAAKVIPVFRTGNMSLGVNLQTSLVKEAARVLGPAFDIEITETHHRLKKDAPSGTALMLADAACEGAGRSFDYKLGRDEKDRRRSPDEIGIHSLRGGTVVGDHTVAFYGSDEVIEITHRAFSKRVFAEGALRAAAFLINKEPGLYDMHCVLDA